MLYIYIYFKIWRHSESWKSISGRPEKLKLIDQRVGKRPANVLSVPHRFPQRGIGIWSLIAATTNASWREERTNHAFASPKQTRKICMRRTAVHRPVDSARRRLAT